MLSDAIQAYLGSARRVGKEKPAGAHLRRFFAQLVQTDIVVPTDPDPLPEHYKELLAALRAPGVDGVEVRLLRRVLASRLRDIFAEKDSVVLVEKLLQIANGQRRMTLNKAVLRGTLRAMDVGGPLLDRCVAYLKQLPAQQMSGVWQYRCEHYALLDRPFAQKIADQLFVADSKEKAQTLLVQSGLRELGDQGLRQLVHRLLTERLVKILVDENIDAKNALFAFNVWETQAVGSAGFRFSGERNSTAEALLLPWKNTNPKQNLKDALLKFFLQHYGDPRSNTPWLGVSAEPKAIAKRWLAEASFELFISIIKKVAPDQWQAREKFWRYYLKNNHVLDLKVAFGAQAATVAREMNRKSGLGEQLVFALLKGAQPDQSVMVMKLSRCTVVEWSHSGKFRLWRANNKDAPSLAAREYHASDVRSDTADEDVAHQGGFWLDRIGAAIHKYSGIKAERQ